MPKANGKAQQLYLEDFSNPFKDSIIGSSLNQSKQKATMFNVGAEIDSMHNQFATDDMI